MKKKDPQQITTFYSGLTAVAAFFTQPIPALDELIVIPMHYRFCRKLARAKGVDESALPWPQIKKVIWYGAGARLVGNFSIGLVPFVGMFSNAITAVVLTKFIAEYLDTALANPGVTPPDVTMESLRKMFDAAIDRFDRSNSQVTVTQ